MSAHKDQYDFSRSSASGKAGFEQFHDTDSGHHLFHFNDENGQPLLFSQPYQTPEKRDNGIESVEKNRSIPGRVVTSASPDGFAVVVRAGNNQEVARSRNYASAELCNLVKNTVIGLNLSEKTTKTSPKEATEPKTSAAAPEAEAVKIAQKESDISSAVPISEVVETAKIAPKTDSSARHVFKISMYQTGENEPFQGKIEHMISNEKAVFSGVNLEAIGGFIQKLIPDIEHPKAAQAVQNAPKMVEPKTVAPIAVVEKLVEHQAGKTAGEPAPVFSYSNAGKNSQPQPAKKMRVLAVANLRFSGADTETETEGFDENEAKAPLFLENKTQKASVSAGQAIVSRGFRAALPVAEPSVSHKLSVVIAPPKMTESAKSVSTKPNFTIISPAQHFTPMQTDVSAKNMVERIIEKAGSRQATVSNAPAIVAPTMPFLAKNTVIIGEKSSKNTEPTTFFIGEKNQKPALPNTAMPPAIRRILDPGMKPTTPPGGYGPKKSVHYVG